MGVPYSIVKKVILGSFFDVDQNAFFSLFGAAGAENQVLGVDFGTFSLRKSPPKRYGPRLF